MSQNQSPLDDQEIRQEIESLLQRKVALPNIVKHVYGEFGVTTTESSIRRAKARWDVEVPDSSFETPGVTINGDEASVTSDPSKTYNAPEDLMRERGLDPEEWEITSMTINEWEGSPTKSDQKEDKTEARLYKQLKINLRRKLKLVLPSPAERIPGLVHKTASDAGKFLSSDPELVVFVGDQQAPFHDQHLHEKFVAWLKKNTPKRGVLIGDTIDLPDVSRHRFDPENSATVQECLNAGYNLLADYVEASPYTEWTKLAGNHDERIRNTLIDRAVKLYDVKRAEIEGADESSVLSIGHLMRLDELGIDFLEPQGSYEHMQHNVSKYLAARHGWLTPKGSGSAALKTLEHLGYSIVVGHTHRQSLVHKTVHSIDGEPTTLAAAETGCMAQIKGGLAYAVAPDWQNGFATASVWPDGKFKLDLATYISNILVWRDQRYEG